MNNLPKGTHSNIWDKQKQHNQGIGDELWLGEVVAMLNEGVILAEGNEQLKEQNKNLKDLLESMADRNNEIWLDNGQIIRLKKIFKGEWTK